MRTNVPRALKALRVQQRLRQVDLGRIASLTRDAVSRAERGMLRGMTLGSLARLADALNAELVVEIRWQGAELDRLIDRFHAMLVAAIARRLEGAGWLVRVEVSFNDFGDRGRCDIVAWHPVTRTLVVVEGKTRLGNLQETLGRLDVKARLGSVIAEQLGWGRPSTVVPALVLTEVGSNRRVLREHDELFRGFEVRGRAALAWLRRPSGAIRGLLWFESPDADGARTDRSARARGRQPAG
ncbi:MAG TPA: helix-turn-helix transcriptional regulator [Candidatus Limnocylindria bacterium]|nr:helix-turn-helix transcriptional regulator [Candidatus Limnocylindria bacterium]